jgi:hypothetical protein
MGKPLSDFEFRGPHPYAFKGAGFLVLKAFSPLADAGPHFHCIVNISFRQMKNRTLHKFGKECGTRLKN